MITPGEFTQYAPEIGGVIDPGYRYIKAGDGYGPNGFGLSGFINEADAKLLAAAPKMLQMLRESIEQEQDPQRYRELQALHVEITGGTA